MITENQEWLLRLSFLQMQFFFLYPFLLLGLRMKSSSSSSLLSLFSRFFAFMSPFFDTCCCFFELSALLVNGRGGGDLIGVPMRICFCFLCFFSNAFFDLSGDNRPCSINLHLHASKSHFKLERTE